ncbi:MAG: peptidylprolyl isomerase [bacterium]
MRQKSALGALALSIMLLSGCNSNIGGLGDKVIMKVNGDSITKSQYEQLYKNTIDTIAAHQDNFNINDPKNKFFKIIYKDKVVNDLTVEELLKQQAKKENVSLTPEDTKKAISDIEKKFGGSQGLEKMLQTNKISREMFETDVKHQILVDKIVEGTKMLKPVSDDDVKKYFDTNKETFFKSPEQVHASHILVNDEKQAKLIVDQLKKNPADFSKLAKKYSKDTQSALKGGDLGYFQAGQMVPEFAAACKTLTPGKISEPVKTQFGYHIIIVIDKKKGGYVAFNDVKASIKDYLNGQQKMDIYKKLVTNARATAKVVYVDKSFDPVNIKKEIIELSKSGSGTDHSPIMPKSSMPPATQQSK